MSLIGGDSPPPMASLPDAHPLQGRGGEGRGGDVADGKDHPGEKVDVGQERRAGAGGGARVNVDVDEMKQGGFDLKLGEYVERVSDDKETGGCDDGGGGGGGGHDERAMSALLMYRGQLAKAQHGVDVEDDAQFVAHNCSIKLTGHLSGHGVSVRGRGRADLTGTHPLSLALRQTHLLSLTPCLTLCRVLLAQEQARRVRDGVRKRCSASVCPLRQRLRLLDLGAPPQLRCCSIRQIRGCSA